MQVQLKGLPVGFVLLASIRYFSRLMDYNQDINEEVYYIINENVVEIDIPIQFDKTHEYAFVRLLCAGVQVYAQLVEKRVDGDIELHSQNYCSHDKGTALLKIHRSYSLEGLLWLRDPHIFSRKEKSGGYRLCTEYGRGFLIKNRLAKAWENSCLRTEFAIDGIVDLKALRVLSEYGLVNQYSFA